MSEMNSSNNGALLMAYINNELSEPDKNQVEIWLNNSIENKKYFEELKEVWILTGKVKIKPVDVNTSLAWHKISERINTAEQSPKKTKVISMRLIYAAAAVVVILFSSVVLIKFISKNNDLIQLSAKKEVVIDTLQDGSVISLNQGSQLEYPAEFSSDERRVTLHGEAFFEITPNAQQPFIVELDHQAEVKVLGTSFNIEESDSTTTVFVKSGKVEFKSTENSVILLPGEKGIMNFADGYVRKASQNEIDFNEIYWLDQKLNFEDQPLDQIISILESIFEVSILLENNKAANCRLTTHFERESIEEILEVIAASFEMELIKTKNGFILKGNGC
ncbi:MAG: FecR family protein [Crocinitomicaceae bacterium]|nr:FecR family protein [Crocinitomicaceae bacterium]